MRIALILAVMPLPAFAWEFSPTPICTLTRQAERGEIVITYDASLPEYAISLTLADGIWPDAPNFTIEFLGARGGNIGTTLQTLSDDKTILSVRDSGFANVLDGLEFNLFMRARSGDVIVVAPLADAAPAVQAFRACPSDTPATS